MTETILAVDDEPDILDLLDYNLRQAGFRVLKATGGRAALDIIRREKPSLALLDLMMPDLSGTEVLRTVRSDPKTRSLPVILLTARGEEIDRLLGFELGADDYVSKPFSVRELVLRVRAILRRNEGEDEEPEAEGEALLTGGPITVDPARHAVTVSGRPVDLTITEFRLLSDLLRARGRVRTRDALLSEVWGYDSEVISRTVDTHIRRLREKLGPGGEWVRTVRGVGYRIEDPALD